MKYSMSPCSGSTLQIRLMLWIRVSLLLIRMGPLRRDLCVLRIAGMGFVTQDCEASEGVVAAPRSKGSDIGT